MTARRLFSILFIVVVTAFAWFILGSSIASRTNQSRTEGGQHVASLWGGRHSQAAPRIFLSRCRDVSREITETDDAGNAVVRTVSKKEETTRPLDLESSSVEVGLAVDHRKRGLLWHATYNVEFSARYEVEIPPIPEDEAQAVTVEFDFPSATAIYDDFSLSFNGKEIEDVHNLDQGISARFDPLAGQTVPIEIRYRSRGLEAWGYRFGLSDVGQVRDFQLAMTTDFGGIDFPPGSLSPTGKRTSGEGWRLDWRFDNLVSGQHIGLAVPNKLNPGPLTARITFFAPVALLFFVTVLIMLGALKHLDLHPMHFFFLAAAFFSFHLLMAYLVDHINIHVAFVTAAAVSLTLTLTYLRLICGLRKALVYAGSAQGVFLVLFSYAFFFEGLTGLSVTVGSILTLFVLMQLTAKVDWNRVFEAEGRALPVEG